MAKKNSSQNNKQSPKASYFLSLSLQNVRCFGGEEQTLDLSDGNGKPARWTILLGENGTGKTTLLQALVALQPIPISDRYEPMLFSRSRIGGNPNHFYRINSDS